jgi:hypothetical protein
LLKITTVNNAIVNNAEIEMSTNEDEQDNTMNCGLSVMERDLLRNKLYALEDTVPPRAVWQRIEQQAKAEGLLQAHWTERSKWLAGAAIAATVVLAVLNIPLAPVVDSGAESFATVPDLSDASENGGIQNLNTLNALMVQSQQIERDLRLLPTQSLVRAGTAVTIAEIEDHIAAIDFTLNHPDLDLSSDQEAIYWRERVRLMNSLLSLRTAQAQRMSF